MKSLFLIILSLFLSCESRSLDSQKFNNLDSLQIINKFNCYFDNEHPSFYTFSKNRNKILDIHLEHIFYNPDSTKMIVITLLEYKNSKVKCSSNDSSTFYFYPFVGYRNNSKAKWEIRYYKNPLLLDGCNRSYLREIISEKFIENIKKKKIFKYANKKYSFELVKCSINEECFWTSPFWEKGRLINNKYNFEVRIKNLILGDFEYILDYDCFNSD